jgi:hypothetical protein
LFVLLILFFTALADTLDQSRSDEHSKDLIKKLLLLDTIGLCAHLSIVVANDSKCREVLARRGTEAQSLLNLLQAVCQCSVYISYLGLTEHSVWICLWIPLPSGVM